MIENQDVFGSTVTNYDDYLSIQNTQTKLAMFYALERSLADSYKKYEECPCFYNHVDQTLAHASTKKDFFNPLADSRVILNESIPAEVAESLFENRSLHRFYTGINFEVRSYASSIFHGLRLMQSIK